MLLYSIRLHCRFYEKNFKVSFRNEHSVNKYYLRFVSDKFCDDKCFLLYHHFTKRCHSESAEGRKKMKLIIFDTLFF